MQPAPRVNIVKDISPGAKLAIALLLVLVLVVGAGNLLATYNQTQHTRAQFAAQQKDPISRMVLDFEDVFQSGKAAQPLRVS